MTLIPLPWLCEFELLVGTPKLSSLPIDTMSGPYILCLGLSPLTKIHHQHMYQVVPQLSTSTQAILASIPFISQFPNITQYLFTPILIPCPLRHHILIPRPPILHPPRQFQPLLPQRRKRPKPRNHLQKRPREDDAVLEPFAPAAGQVGALGVEGRAGAEGVAVEG